MERPHWSEVARNIFNLIRDGGLFALIVALLFFPGPMVAQLQTAGVTHASAFGIDIEIEKQVREAKLQSEEALKQTQVANDQLAQTQVALQSAAAKVQQIESANPAVAEQTATISRDLAKTSQQVVVAQSRITQTIQKQNEVVLSQDAILARIATVRARN